MGALPDGWEICRFEECIEILDSMRKPINNKERNSRIHGKTPNELYPYYGATGQVGLIDGYLFDEELVALGEDGVPFFDTLKEKAYMLYGKTWVNNHAHVLKGSNGVNNRYVCYYLNQIDYHGYVNGATRLKLTQANMRKLPFMLAPLKEQICIANKLDSLLAKVEAAQTRLAKIPTQLKRFRQAVLAAVTSGELTREWREDNKKSRNWDSITIDQLCENSFYGPRFSKDDYVVDGIPTIRTTDMTRNGTILITNETPRIAVPKEKIELFKVRKNDLLITRTGSIGVMAIFKGNYLAMPSAYLIRFRFISGVSVDYLYYFLTSPTGQRLLGLGTTSVTQPNINAKVIRAIGLDLPDHEE